MKEILDIMPIKFKNITCVGNQGFDYMSINYRLSKLITQNTLYSAYFEERTVKEISELLGTQVSVIEEEIEFLEENGFISKTLNNKYKTNILISDYPQDIYERRHEIYTKYARIVCDTYIPLLVKKVEDWFQASSRRDVACYVQQSKLSLRGTKQSRSGDFQSPNPEIYVPEDDFNYLLWSIITIAYHQIATPKDALSKHYILGKDGSENIIIASVKKDYNLSYNEEKLSYFSEQHYVFTLNRYNFTLFLCNTNYDDRMDELIIYSQEKLIYLHEYIHCRGDVPIACKYPSSFGYDKEKMKVLFDNNYLIKEGTKEYVNMIVSKLSVHELLNVLPSFTDEFQKLNKDLDNELYNLVKSQYPQHLLEVCQAYNTNSIFSGEIINRIISILLERGVLKPLSDRQKKTVNMIMFCDMLPVFR